MKNLKKLIALIAVLALTLSTVALGATYTDVAEDSAYSVAVESLSKLGIVTGYEDGTYGPEKAVTRAEMAALIARIQGYEESAKANAVTVFTDVAADHWASGYIALASNMGIVNGYGDGTFGPEDSVKYEQAVTMIMRTLGYEPFAATNGGYPTGYLAAAQRYGVTKNVSNAVSGTDANRGTIAQLLYNGIDTPIMGQSKWGTNGDIEYTIYDGTGDVDYRTLMSENLGVVKIKGVVVASDVASINGTVDIDITKDSKATVKILDTYDSNNTDFASYKGYTLRELEALDLSETFLVGESDVADMLGRRVILYVVADEVSDEYVIISAAKDTTSNQEVSFTVDQYDSLDTTGSKDKLEYYKNATDRDTTAVTLEDDAVVVYNNVGGKTVAAVFDESTGILADKTLSGKVTLVDNDSTNGYDVVFVEIGVSGVVDEISEAGDRISFKDNIILANGGGSISKVEVDPDEENKIIKLVKDGVEITPAELVEWDVITIVAETRASNYIVAEVIGTPVTGVINSKASSETSYDGFEYRVDGTGYDVANNAYGASDIKIGNGGIFYIDKYGKIVAFDEDATVAGGSAGNYAYVIEGGVDESFTTTYGQLRLLTANGVDIYDVADEFEYNGEDYEIGETAGAGVLTEAQFKAAFVGEMILYRTDSTGAIDTIETAGYDAFSVASSGTDDWDADNFNLGGDVDEDAIVFLLGANVKTESIVGTIADLEDGEEYGYVRFNEEDVDGAVLLITSGFANVGASSSVAVITDVAEGSNDDSEDVLILSYYQDGELVEDVLTSETVYNSYKNDLTIGDIIKIKVSSEGVITALSMYVDFDDPVRARSGLISNTGVSEVTNGDEKYAFGYAIGYNKTSKSVTLNNASESFRLTNADVIYVIDASLKSNIVEVGSAGDFEYDATLLSDYDKYADYVFVRKLEGSVKDVVIVKNIADYDTDDMNADLLAAAEAELATAETALTAAEATLTAKETALADAVAAGKTAAGLTGEETVGEIKTALEALGTTAGDDALAAIETAEADVADAEEAVEDAEEEVAEIEARIAEIEEALGIN